MIDLFSPYFTICLPSGVFVTENYTFESNNVITLELSPFSVHLCQGNVRLLYIYLTVLSFVILLQTSNKNEVLGIYTLISVNNDRFIAF